MDVGIVPKSEAAEINVRSSTVSLPHGPSHAMMGRSVPTISDLGVARSEALDDDLACGEGAAYGSGRLGHVRRGDRADRNRLLLAR